MICDQAFFFRAMGFLLSAASPVFSYIYIYMNAGN